MSRFVSKGIAFVLSVALALPGTAWAHNESVHQRMTDFAYHVLLASARFSGGQTVSARLAPVMKRLADADPAVKVFYAAAVPAVKKLRELKSGLPDVATLCLDAQVIIAMGSPQPAWQLPAGTALPDLPMSGVRLPVGIGYAHGVDCGIDGAYTPSGVLASANPGGFTARDHTGVTLGYWAAAPDKEKKDWVLHSTTLETLQNPVVLAQIGATTTVAVSTVCLLACGLFPPACAACPILALGAGGTVVDEIASIDADALESEDYVGFGHFIDMKPTPASPAPFDEKPGKLMSRAGPTGTTDVTEDLVMMIFDIAGMHVNRGASQAPRDYQVILGTSGALGDDAHRNSTARSFAQWELPLIPDLQLTAVDNLGMFGYLQSKANRGTSLESRNLGWPLHALGDASVPMHTVGASGFGHRPYEDCVDMVFDQLVGSDNLAVSVTTVSEVITRAVKWRKFISDWRKTNASTDVPVRDLITALAAATRSKATARPEAFQPVASLTYILDEDAAVAVYDTPAMAEVQRDLLLDGIAAEVTFLLSVTEVTP